MGGVYWYSHWIGHFVGEAGRYRTNIPWPRGNINKVQVVLDGDLVKANGCRLGKWPNQRQPAGRTNVRWSSHRLYRSCYPTAATFAGECSLTVTQFRRLRNRQHLYQAPLSRFDAADTRLVVEASWTIATRGKTGDQRADSRPALQCVSGS